jgi:hypothetical protein
MPPVTSTVPFDLSDPVSGFRFDFPRAVDTPAASVPKTAVNEDTRLDRGKDEIGLARQISAMEPIAQPSPMEKIPDL